MPGGGGGNDAVPPFSKGVMRRMVTRRLMRLGPSVCSFRYCAPYPCEVRFSAGTWNCWVSNSAADSARRSDSDRLSTSLPTASVWPSIRNTSRGLRWIARLRPSAITCSLAAWSGGISHDPVHRWGLHGLVDHIRRRNVGFDDVAVERNADDRRRQVDIEAADRARIAIAVVDDDDLAALAVPPDPAQQLTVAADHGDDLRAVGTNHDGTGLCADHLGLDVARTIAEAI